MIKKIVIMLLILAAIIVVFFAIKSKHRLQSITDNGFFHYFEFQEDSEIIFSNNISISEYDNTFGVSILPHARIFYFDTDVFTEDEIQEMVGLIYSENEKKVSEQEILRFIVKKSKSNLIVDMRIATDEELEEIDRERSER